VERLDAADLEALVTGLHDLAAPRPFEAFPAAALRVVRSLVPGVVHSYTEIDLRRRQTTIVVDPPDMMFPGGEELLVRYAHEHPLIARFAEQASHPALTISDFLSTREFHRLGLYGDLYHRIDTEDQLAIGLPAVPEVAVGIVANRGSEGFSGRDRLVFDLLSPHLAQAFRGAQLMTSMQRALEGEDRLSLLLDADGAARFASDRARALLAAYFGPTRSPHGLPHEIQCWLRVQRSRLSAYDDAPMPAEPLVVRRGERCLRIRFFTAPLSDAAGVLVLHERREGLTVEALRPLGLGGREAEVLLWVTRGKTNPEVGEILGISPRTVQKHLEHIFDKLGVAGRTEAAVRALDVAR